MIGVKLTILGIILLFLTILVSKILVTGCDVKTKLAISMNKGPIWFDILAYITTILIIVDVIGVLYTSIWFLFIR